MSRPPTISIAFQTNKPIRDYGPLAARAEALGFDGVTVYNDLLYQPAWLPLLEIARATERVRLGPAAVNPFTSHPINIAGHIALLDEMSHGRTYLGLARGAWLDFLGIRPQQPIAVLTSAIRTVQHLLSGSHDPLPDPHFPLAGGDGLRWTLPERPIPVLLGSWGPKTIRATATLIDEVKLGGSANPDVAAWLRRYLAKFGQPDVGVVIGAVTVVDEDGAAARALARREVALYLPVVATLDPTLTVEPERLARIKAAADSYDYETAAAHISDDLLARFAFAGTPTDIIAQSAALFAAGATRIEFGTPHGRSPAHGLDLLGKVVLPALQATIEDS